MKMALWLGLAFFALIILFIFWAAYPWSLKEKTISPEILYLETVDMMDVEEHPSVIKILTWNLGFLYGKGSEGPGYIPKDKAFYQERLDQLVREIKDWGPDIIFLQEVDFDSSRSHGINQAQYLAVKAGYPYVAEAISWKANYIPFPYWPLSRNFGGVSSGGAILSKYPITDHEVYLTDKPASNPWWYNLFYLHRYFQKVTIELGDKDYKFINLHLEAFDKVNRTSQIKLLAKKIKSESVGLVAGDFNMLPPSAVKRSKFENDDNYEDDPSYEAMLRSGLSEVIPDEIYAKDESLYFTFPSDKPDRRLDYIFYHPQLKMMKAEVLPSALSDHLPLRATFQIDSPRINPYSL